MQAGSYELLLELADAFPQDATIRDITSQLLNLMPTFPDITQRLAEALLGGQNASALSELWTEAGQDDEAASVKAAHLKYTIEVCAPLSHPGSVLGPPKGWVCATLWATQTKAICPC